MCKVLHIPLNNRRGFENANTGLSILEYHKDNKQIMVITLNIILHLT